MTPMKMRIRMVSTMATIEAEAVVDEVAAVAVAPAVDQIVNPLILLASH
jgi:hypothetical protein